MERLTYKDSTLPRKSDGGETIEAYSDYDVREIINRLAAYEDTGLEPEKIEDRQDVCLWIPEERFSEIIKAEQEGRLVVLPCKIGDEVWCIKRFNRARKVVSAHVSEMYFSSEMRLVIVCYHAVRGELGKTVFLTRAEAEKAMEGEKT